MALTAEEIRSHTGLAPELREVLIEMRAEFQSGGYVLRPAPPFFLGGEKQAAAVTDPESEEAAAVSTSLKALTASLRAAGILQA